MNATELSAAAGIVLSLAFSYTPRLKDWFGAKDATTKRLIMLLLLVVVTAGALLYKCGLAEGAPLCVTTNWHEYAVALVAAAITNQTTYQLTPLPDSAPASPKA